MDNRIDIHIINEVITNNALSDGTGSSKKSPSSSGVSKSKEKATEGGENNGQKIFRNAFLNTRKLLAATGNESMQKINNAMSTGVRLGMNVVKAMTGNPIEIINLGVDIAAEALNLAVQNAQKIAQMNNEADTNGVLSGTLDISDINISKGFFSGRYYYNNK